MQTEAINNPKEVPQEQEPSQSKPFNFSLDGNLGMQMALMSGLGGILYYLFSCTCPSWSVYQPPYGENGEQSERVSKETL